MCGFDASVWIRHATCDMQSANTHDRRACNKIINIVKRVWGREREREREREKEREIE